MKTRYAAAAAMVAGVLLGGVSVGALYAQGKAPGAYVVVGLTEVDDMAAYKTNVIEKASPVVEKHGGRLLVRTNNITELRAADPPIKRWILIGFDNVQQAKSWYASEDMKPINAYINQHSKGRAFVVEAESR